MLAQNYLNKSDQFFLKKTLKINLCNVIYFLKSFINLDNAFAIAEIKFSKINIKE